jgi:tripartite-type tricarboxylate transporter receptor subunit TctC
LQGLGAPRNTPAEIVAKLNNEINAALGKADVAATGQTVLARPPFEAPLPTKSMN